MGFLFSVFFLVFGSSTGGSWWCCGEKKRGMVFNTAGAEGEDCLLSVCVGKEDDFALHCGFTHSKGSRACVKNVQVHKGATELRN